MTELDYPSFYVGRQIRVKVSGVGLYDGVVYSNTVAIQDDPAKLKNVIINQEAQSFSTDMTFIALDIGYGDIPAEFIFEPNDVNAVITIDGKEGNSCILENPADQQQLVVAVTYGGVTNTYYFTLNVETVPESGKLTLDLSNISGITDADVLTADWTAPDGSTGQLTADSTSLTVSADVPYESEVRVYTRHQEAGSEYPDIFQVHLSNDDSDKYDYELPEIKDGNVCGCESCGNAYEFVMDKGDVTYYLENDCYAFPAPKITADWAADGTAVFTVTLPGTESKLPVDTHNTDRYQRIALRLTDENGKYRQDSVFEESAKNYIYLEPENDGDPLSVTSVTIAADNVDPEQDYYVQAYYIPDLRDCPDKYIQSTVKLEARGKIALEPVTFGKTLVDGQYMDLYSNGIITLPMQKNTVTQLDLSFGGNSKYLDKMSCTVENDREDVVTASYVLDGEQPRLVFTPLKTGTAYLTLKASLFDQAVTVIWRVNVVANTVVLKPGLKSKTVTVNPAKTDYTAIQMRTAIHDYSNSLSWEFVGNQREILNKCFDLVQIDSQTLEIRPDWEGINQIGGMNKLASSYKVQLCVRSGETGSYAYTSEFLTMKIDKKLPTVKAGKAKLNSFYSNAETVLNLTASAGRVTKVTIDESKANAKGNVYGSWADIFWDEESGTASVIASKRNFKASGKLYLKVYLEGYSEHTPVSVAVSVSAASTAPKLKLSSSSITMAETGSSFLMQVLSGNGKISLEETGFTKIRLATSYEIAAMSEKERAAYAITTDYIIYQYASLEPNEFILHCNATAKPGKILLYAVIGDDEQQMVPLVLTVKTAKTSTVKFNKKSVVLNSSLGDGSDVQTVRIITSCVNLTIGKEMLSVKDSTGADASDRLQVEFDFQEKSLEISTLENCPDGTYQIELAVPGVKKTAVTKVKVQSTAPVFKLSKTKVTINSLKNEVTEILLTPKTAGYEELESGKINLVLKKNGLILAEETAENGISQDGLKISYSNYISYVSGNQGFRLQTTAALSGVYTLEISYTCPDGSESKPVKLTINVQAPMPTVKPAYTSMTIQEDRVSTQFDLAYTISAKNLYRGSVRYALEDEEGNVVRTSSSSYEDKESGTGYCRFTLTDLQAGENWKLKLWYYADGFTGKEAVVKIKGTTADPTVNISMKGNLDLSKENGGLVTITPKYANYAQQPTFTVKFDVYAKEGGQPITGSSAYVGTGGKLVFSKWFKAELNRYTGTYTLTINQDEGSAYAENLWSAGYTYTIKPYIMINGLSYYGKEMKLNVKQSTLKVTQSAKEVVLCSSDQYDREYIRLTLNDVNAAAIRDVQVAAGSAAGYDVVYYENGLCAIRFLDDTPAAKGGKLKLNIFVDGVSDSGAKVKANAAAQVTVKLVTAE